MKIEFVKETKVTGEIYYFTKIDGKFADKSLAYDYDKARSLFSNIVVNKGRIDFEEVLETIEI